MVQLIRERVERRNEEGILAVIVAFSAIMIFVLAALVVDLGLARDTDRQAQNSADAAVLAAGNALYDVGKTPHFDLAIEAAEDYAESNFGVTDADWASCTDEDALDHQVDGDTPCISFNSATAPTEVRVVIPERRVDTPLAGVAGQSHVDVSGEAQMMLQPNTKSRCALCVIGDGPHDLQNGNVEVTGGDIHFNGTVSVQPNGLVSTDGAITVEEEAVGDRYSPQPDEGAEPVLDPLAFRAPITYSHLLPKTNPCTDGPGIYHGYTGGCSAPLLPGLYVFTGQWSFNGESLVAPGVTMYFTCGPEGSPEPCDSPGETGGSFKIGGNGRFEIHAPTDDSDPNKGLAIVYHPFNTSPLDMRGTGEKVFAGTIYAPRSTLDYRGTSDGDTSDSLIVVGSMRFTGTALLDFDYNADSNVNMPPTDLHLSR